LEEIENTIKANNVKLEKFDKKVVKQDSTIKEKSENLRNEVFELISKSQRSMDKQYNNIIKDIDNTKTVCTEIVVHSKEHTNQLLKGQIEKTNNLMDEFKLDIMQTNESEIRLLITDMGTLKEDIDNIREEFKKNDKLFERNINELSSEFKIFNNLVVKPSQFNENKLLEVECKMKE